MNTLIQIESGDRQLLAEIGAAMDNAARRSGDWVVCKLGCTECCIGPFAITRLDAMRLRQGLAALEATDPARAAAVRARAASYIGAVGAIYPGDPVTGELIDEDSLPEAMDDLACPALDPDTGGCDLYAARPVTCRSFGAATQIGGGRIAACELCYAGASAEEIAACAVELDPEGLEARLVGELEQAGLKGTTIIAYALAL